MKRREFIPLLGGAACAWPLAARTQQQEKIPRIGVIDDAPMWNAFREGLRDLGYLEGQNIAFEYCCLLRSQSTWGKGCHDDIYLRTHKLSSQLRQPSRIAIRGTQLEDKVLTLRIADISESEPQFPSQ